jgi:glycerol uptake facilitator-like aquaporin
VSDLARRLSAEALGTGFLLAGVVGSGIMGERLTDDVALQLLCNALATGGILFVIIMMFCNLSGAHFNPAVTIAMMIDKTISARDAALYVTAQIAGGAIGVWASHAMFAAPVFDLGVNVRSGAGLWLAETVATFGLVLTIFAVRMRAVETIAASVALYIVAAYWFTASTSFANPAVTLARSLTPSFSGIRPLDAPGFIAAQVFGAVVAVVVARVLFLSRDARS